MSYQPTPGTIPFKAIAHLRAHAPGMEFTSAVLAEASDAEPSQMAAYLRAAERAGVVRKRAEGRMLFWSLGDGTPISCEEDILPHRTVAPDVKPQPGAMFPGGVRGDEPVPPSDARLGPNAVFELQQARLRPMTLRECAEAEERPAAPLPFDAWFSGRTGQLFLRGVRIDDDGDAILGKEDVRVLLAALSGVTV